MNLQMMRFAPKVSAPASARVPLQATVPQKPRITEGFRPGLASRSAAEGAAAIAQAQRIGAVDGATTLREVEASMNHCARAFGEEYLVRVEGSRVTLQDPAGRPVMSLELTGNTASLRVGYEERGEVQLGRKPSDAVGAIAAGVHAAQSMPGFEVSVFNDHRSGAPSVMVSAGHDGPDHVIAVKNGTAEFSTGDLRGSSPWGRCSLDQVPMTSISAALQVKNASRLVPGSSVAVGTNAATGKAVVEMKTGAGQSYQFNVTGESSLSAGVVEHGKFRPLDSSVSLEGEGHVELEHFFRSGQVAGVDTSAEREILPETQAALQRRADELTRTTGVRHTVEESVAPDGRTLLTLANTETGEGVAVKLDGDTGGLLVLGGERGNYDAGDLRLYQPSKALATFFAAERLSGPDDRIDARIGHRGSSELTVRDGSGAHHTTDQVFHTGYDGSVSMGVIPSGKGDYVHLTHLSPGHFARTEIETAMLLGRSREPGAVQTERFGNTNRFLVRGHDGATYAFTPVAGGEVAVTRNGQPLPKLVLGEDAAVDFSRYVNKHGI